VGSASRESLERAKAALADASGVTLAVGDQLLEAGRIVEHTPQLRSVLADPSYEPQQKAGLIRTVFAAMQPTAVELLSGIAASRWSTPGELLEGIEEIGVRAVARSHGHDGAIESELFTFAAAIQSDAELEIALGSKLGDTSGRVGIVDRLLEGKANDATLVLARYSVQAQRGRRIGVLIERIADIVADDGDSIVAEVTAAVPPTEAQLTTLHSVIAAKYGRAARFNLSIDPELVGGLRVQVGDEVIDGSIAGRLSDLRLRLAG
jgi:F-type H+-transporting ATPase subunit delta